MRRNAITGLEVAFVATVIIGVAVALWPRFEQKRIDAKAQRWDEVAKIIRADTPLDRPLREYLKGLSPVEPKPGNYDTFLHIAAYHNNYDLVKALVDAGANVNAVCVRYGSVLQAAGDGQVAELLLSHGARLHPTRKSDLGPELALAIKYKLPQSVTLLIEQGSNFHEYESQLLHLSAKSNAVETIGLLLERGANIDSPKAGGATPLTTAVSERYHEAMLFLLERGADPNGGLSAGAPTALHEAARQGDMDMVQCLIDWGAEVNGIELINGETPLHWAAREQSMFALKVLLTAGADRSIKNYSGQTALDIALESVANMPSPNSNAESKFLEHRESSLVRLLTPPPQVAPNLAQ